MVLSVPLNWNHSASTQRPLSAGADHRTMSDLTTDREHDHTKPLFPMDFANSDIAVNMHSLASPGAWPHWRIVCVKLDFLQLSWLRCPCQKQQVIIGGRKCAEIHYYLSLVETDVLIARREDLQIKSGLKSNRLMKPFIT